MPLIYFDFHCPDCGNTFDRMVTQEVHATSCPNCSCETATRLISPVRIDYKSMDTPHAIRMWDKSRRQKMKIEQKNQLNHGTYD